MGRPVMHYLWGMALHLKGHDCAATSVNQLHTLLLRGRETAD